jgi:predicted esterase
MTGMTNDPASGLDYIVAGNTDKPKRMIVVLHGTGDNCEGIHPLAELFAKLPDTVVVIPNGGVPLSQIMSAEQIEATKAENPGFDADKARNWTGPSKIEVIDDDTLMQALDEMMAGPVLSLNAFVDAQRDKYGLKDKDILFYGFSAGGLMALHASIDRPEACAGVISHSGHFLGAYDAVSKPKVLMIAGDQEMAHPQVRQMLSGSAEALRALGLDVKEHVCENLGHGVNREAMQTAATFMKESFGLTEVPKRAPRTLDPPTP